MTQKIHDALLTFCRNPVAVVADISKAFHRILIAPEHRRYTKFLWVACDEVPLSSYQFRVVIFGACSSPYILQQVLHTDLSSSAIPDLEQNFYVDNFSRTYRSVDVAIAEKPVIDEILSSASMPLQGWTSNDPSFKAEFKVEEPHIQNMLGMTWNTESDTLHYKFSKKFPVDLQHWKPTKRNFMSALATVYDPLGLLGPLVVGSKIFLQDLWVRGLTWDEVIPAELQKIAS